MLAHIKRCAEAQVDAEIDAICLGRPVRFHGLRGEEGNRQAVAILETAAIAAGFDYVEFMFGPSTVFWNAVTVNDVNALAEFSSKKNRRELGQLLGRAQGKQKVARLLALYDGRHNYRLNRSAELAKIALSDRESTSLALDYIESDLVIPLPRADLRESVERELGKFVELMKEVERQAQSAPDVIYVTGGTAKSPMIEECIREHFSGVEIGVGDLFGSVTSGLATWAHRTFR